MYVCVHGHRFGGGGWKHLILLEQEAVNHVGSSCNDPMGAELGLLDSGRLPVLAWPLADTKLVVQGVLTSPSQGRPRHHYAHQVGTLQALSCTGKCFSFGSGCGSH